MKKLIVFIKGMLGGMLMLASIVPAHATHLMGSDLTWQCLGNNEYKVILRMYRDCTGLPMSNTPLGINYHCASNISISGGELFVSTPVINGLDVTPVCGDTCSKCDVNQLGGDPNCAFGYGMELYQYEFTVNVTALKNAGCCKVRFYWTACCRNGAIDNLQNPISYGFYTYGEVDICDSPCNNGPAFTNPVAAFFCNGQDVIYNMGLTDVDSDSIVVTLAEPYYSGPTNINPTGNFVPIPYVTGYSKDKPLKFLGWPNPYLPLPYGFHLNPATGDLRFRPTQTGAYVIVLEIEEYRNGQLVGKTRRDIQVWIVDCPDNHTPKLSGINGTSSFSTEVCEEAQVCFNIYSQDVDTADSLTLSWNAAIPGATFTVTQPAQNQTLVVQGPTGQFCWTPPPGSARPMPYRFTANVTDNACPIRAEAI